MTTLTKLRLSSTVGLLAALAFAAALRIALARYSLWFDELASVFFARQPLTSLWGNWMLRESNPPLYYTLLKVWVAVVGLGAVKLRLLSIIASLLVIIVHYAGISRIYGRRAGIVAAMLLALSGEQLHFSHLIRTYIFLYLAVSISFYGLLEIVRTGDKPGRKPFWPWSVYIVGAIVGVYLHTTACIWPIVATLSLMLADRRFRPTISHYRWLKLVLADVAIMAGSSWWLTMTYLQLRTPSGNIGWLEWHGLADTASTFVSALFLTFKASGWQAIAPVAVAIIALFGGVRTFARPETKVTVACLMLSIILFTSVSLIQPIIIEATLFWISIFSLVLASAGLDSIANKKLFFGTLSAIMLLLSLNLIEIARHLEREDWTTAVIVPFKDHHAALLVDSEAVNVLVNTACTVELSKDRCPFPVLTIQRRNLRADAWANGYGTRATLLPDNRLALGNVANIYLFRQMSYDVLELVHDVGLLKSVSTDQPKTLGPFSTAFIDDLNARAPLQNGILTVRADAKAP